jgi:hypothetical protein
LNDDDGSSLKPLLILSTGSIVEKIMEAGYTEDKVLFIYQNHGFTTKRLFKFWAETIFFPYVKEKRSHFSYAGSAILLMDQFSGQEYECFEDECRSNRVISRPLLSHTSHLSQPLDQIVFSVFKHRFTRIRCNGYSTTSSNQIIWILRAWFQTISADLVTSTFIGAGIVSEKILHGSVMSCCVDLNRSILMKDILPDVIPETQRTGKEVIQEADHAETSTYSHLPSQSAPVSPIKKPMKRYKIVKLEPTEPQRNKQTESWHDPVLPIDARQDINSHPITKQLKLDDMFQVKRTVPSELVESLDVQKSFNPDI